MNRQHIQVLARYELMQSLLSTRGVLFLIIYGTLWFWLLWKMSSGWAANLATEQGLAIMSWLFDPVLARVLFAEQAPTLSLFFLLFMALIPVFTLWGAGDQTATDIGTHHLRFLIPRCGRQEIYLGRFIGALLFMTLVHAVIVGVGVAVALYTDVHPGTVAYGARILLVTFLYTLPYIALMSLYGAMLGSAAAAILTAIASYALVAIAGSLMAMQWKEAIYIGYLFPSPMKGALLTGDGTTFAVAMGALVAYAVIYFALGWYIFQRRDI
jgi:ABC-type transport system involved in multi-copper enzyme maturation permease subunit